MLGTTIGRYRIKERLSSGGMGEIYVGEHTLLGRLAAIKVLLPHISQRPKIVQRFFQEAKATGALGHPGIVDVFDYGEAEDGRAYLVMEYLDGENLGDRIKRDPKPAVDWSLAILQQVCSALGAAHKKNIVHRDLKPDNIFLVRDPNTRFRERPKLLDFGIAKLQNDENSSVQTRTGVVMGTPAYMSPEQCRGAGRVDHRADLYSLGCIFFELFCGRRPFIAEGAGEVIGMHQFKEPPRPSAIAPGIHADAESLILDLLAKHPDDRVQSTDALAERLDQLERTLGLKRRRRTVSQADMNTAQDMPPIPRPDNAMGGIVELETERAPAADLSGAAYAAAASTSQPGYDAASTSQPGYGSASTSQPGYGSASTSQPGYDAASTSQPGYDSASTSQPGYDSASTSQPGHTGPSVNSGMMPLDAMAASQPSVTTLSGAAAESTPNQSSSGSRWPLLLAVIALIGAGIGGAMFLRGGGDDADKAAASSTEVEEPPTTTPDTTDTPTPKDGTGEQPATTTDTPAPKDGTGEQPATTTDTPAPKDGPDQATSVEMVTLRLESTPSRAYVYRRGQDKLLGKTPLSLELPRGDEKLRFDLRVRGYYKKTVDFRPTEDGSEKVELKKRPAKKTTTTDVPDIVF